MITLIVLLLSTPTIFLCIELVAGLTSSRQPRTTENNQIAPDDIVVLIPAHNESEVIETTLNSITDCGIDKKQVLVVADNCTDDTYDKVVSNGFNATRRYSEVEIGKGFALAHGINFLSENPPSAVLILDADCILHTGAIEVLSQESSGQKIVQANYLMIAPEGASLSLRVAQFFFHMKNHVRLLGLRALGGSPVLTGSGMLFPWSALTSLKIASDHITEDTKFGLDAQLKNIEVSFQPVATVTSIFPKNADARQGQAQRWESGNLSLMKSYVPKLVKAAIARKSKVLLLAAFNLSIPPLSILLTIQAFLLLITLIIIIFIGTVAPFVTASTIFILLATCLLACWYSYGRELISVTELFSLPLFACKKKFPLYLSMISSRQTKWVKTERD